MDEDTTPVRVAEHRTRHASYYRVSINMGYTTAKYLELQHLQHLMLKSRNETFTVKAFCRLYINEF